MLHKISLRENRQIFGLQKRMEYYRRRIKTDIYEQMGDYKGY